MAGAADIRAEARLTAATALAALFKVTVPPVASLSLLTFSRDVVHMANRRWLVIALFHGVGGAGVVGSGMLGPSRLPRRAMASCIPAITVGDV